MSFWANALNTGAPSPAPAPAQPPAGGPWWAQPAYAVPAQPPALPLAPEPVHEPAAPSRAASARVTSHCPECGSENYYSPAGTNSMVKCFECGHNARFTQMASGGGIQGDASPATPAKQVSTANNFNPQQIIGKIG